MQSKVPSLDLGGSGGLLFFAHANGYPPLAYQALLEPLTSSYHVVAGLHRPLWPEAEAPATLKSWDVFGEDIVAALGQLNKPAVCIGHSMGSAALVMASVRSQLPIKGLILIEPVLMPPSYYRMLRMFRWLARRRVPLIRRTLTRQLAIRGGESTTLDQSNWQRWQSKAPQHDYAEVPGTGHLVPFEKPEYLRDLIREWLGSRPELDLAHC